MKFRTVRITLPIPVLSAEFRALKRLRDENGREFLAFVFLTSCLIADCKPHRKGICLGKSAMLEPALLFRSIGPSASLVISDFRSIFGKRIGVASQMTREAAIFKRENASSEIHDEFNLLLSSTIDSQTKRLLHTSSVLWLFRQNMCCCF
jgi:hypothetical protein